MLGLVKHAANWERRWFQVIIGGRESGEDWPTVRGQHEATLLVGEHDTVDYWVAYYREQIEQSGAVAPSMDLDSSFARKDLIECNLRYVLFHLIEETAHHAGHADIIRNGHRPSGMRALSPQLPQNSRSTGTVALPRTMCVCPGSSRSVACGSAAATAACAFFRYVGLLPPTITRAGAVTSER